MVEATDELIGRMVEAIVRAVDPEEVILFGSRARGDHRGRSDVDLLIVEREPFGPGRSRRAESTRIHQALWGCRVPTDILIFSRDEVEEWRDSLNHVIAQALREGKRLYARSQARADAVGPRP